MKKIIWRLSDGEVDDLTIREVENKLGVYFPDDYKECVKINNGARPTPYCFLVNGVERIFGALLRIINPDDGHFELLETYRDIKDRLPEGVIPFAEDPFGNFICFDYKDHKKNPIVVFWYHEGAWPIEELMEEEGLTKEEAEKVVREENIRYVASSFTELLEMLYADDE